MRITSFIFTLIVICGLLQSACSSSGKMGGKRYVAAVSIDGVNYDSASVATLRVSMKNAADKLLAETRLELDRKVNELFDACINNVDSYLDELRKEKQTHGAKLIGIAKSTVDIITGGTAVSKRIDREGELAVNNYFKKISKGVNFSAMGVLLDEKRRVGQEYTQTYASKLKNVIVPENVNGAQIRVVSEISGNDYMASLLSYSEYLNRVQSDFLPFLNIGNQSVLTSAFANFLESSTASDLADITVEIIPGAAGSLVRMGLGLLTMISEEKQNSPEFKEKIVSSINGERKRILATINYGGVL